MVLPTGTWQRGDNHREPRSVPRQISCVGVLGADGTGDHSHSRCLHRQDYDSLLGKRNMEHANIINERLLFTQFVFVFIISASYWVHLFACAPALKESCLKGKPFKSKRDVVSEYSQACWPDSQACWKM